MMVCFPHQHHKPQIKLNALARMDTLKKGKSAQNVIAKGAEVVNLVIA
jgi:hypothetical protein